MPRREFGSREEAQQFVAANGGGSLTRRNRSTATTDADGNPIDEPVWYVEYSDNPYQEEGVPDWAYDLYGIPGAGWLSGADARIDRAQNLRQQRSAEEAWTGLGVVAPTRDELTVDYEQERGRDQWGDLRGPGTEIRGGSQGLRGQYDALSALREIANAGGYTRADEMARNQAAMANAQRLGGANQAAIQQMNARGLGGGGAELAARMMGSQAYTQGQAMADAQIQSGAMQRAMQAIQGMGAIGGSIDQGEFRRQSALDAFNQRQMDWRRDREERNTTWRNRGRESQSNAAQQWYENAERRVAGLTNQYQAGQGNRRADAARQDQTNQSILGALGTVIEEAF